MINDVLEYVGRLKEKTSDIKLKSPIYPKVYSEDDNGVAYFSTLVHWEYRGVLYSRHHLESCNRSPMYSEDEWVRCKAQTEKRLNNAAKMCVEKAVPCRFDDVVKVIDNK